MCEFSFLASGMSLDGITVVAENVHVEYHCMLVYLWECICIFVPVLYEQVYGQVYSDSTNVRGNNPDVEIKLSFPKSCAEGPSSQPTRVQSLKSFLSVLFELLVNREGGKVLPSWNHVFFPLLSY